MCKLADVATSLLLCNLDKESMECDMCLGLRKESDSVKEKIKGVIIH